MVTIDDVRRVTDTLPRSYEAVVRDRLKFRVGRLVYAALSRDELTIGFGFDKHERAALVAADPARYLMPPAGDLRYNWICARMAALDADLLRDHLEQAWAMCVPKFLARDYLAADR